MVEAGNFRKVAAEAAGITRLTLYRWLKRGEEGEEPYATFYAQVSAAEALAEAKLVHRISRAGENDWRAAAWILERRGAKRWTVKQHMEVSGPDGDAIRVQADNVRERIAALVGDDDSGDED